MGLFTQKSRLLVLLFLGIGCGRSMSADRSSDIRTVPPDLEVPVMIDAPSAAGKRVRVVTLKYEGTKVYHSLYLPTDWKAGKKYPVIVEYAGNGPFENKLGDRCSGKVEDCHLGYGIRGGKGAIWICLPYISKDGKNNQLKWWGDVDATVAYCKDVIARVCKDYGGDAQAVFLAGFSRGAIACNFIGLHDDEIASLWRGFICHSHYDGVRKWAYAGSDRAAASLRLKRLNNRPQFISQEGSVNETREYLKKACPTGKFTFQALPYRNHTDSWVLRDIRERQVLREWFEAVLNHGEIHPTTKPRL